MNASSFFFRSYFEKEKKAMAYYKDNSDAQRSKKEVTEQPPVKRVEKIASGQAVAPKRTMKDYLHGFLSKGSKSIGAYLLEDVLAPAAQKTAVDLAKAVSDTFVTGISTVVYHGEPPKRQSTPASRVSYASYYEQRDRGYSPPPRTTSYDDVSFETRGEAEEVLAAMDDLMQTYQLVRVSDLYEMAGLTCDYTNNNYGWTDISTARVERSRYDNRFVIRMPRPMPITNG